VFVWDGEGSDIRPDQKKPPGCARRFVEDLCACFFAYALFSPAAERCENQKYAKKQAWESMGRNVARPARLASADESTFVGLQFSTRLGALRRKLLVARSRATHAGAVSTKNKETTR
jgi:hypothetical protein